MANTTTTKTSTKAAAKGIRPAFQLGAKQMETWETLTDDQRKRANEMDGPGMTAAKVLAAVQQDAPAKVTKAPAAKATKATPAKATSKKATPAAGGPAHPGRTWEALLGERNISQSEAARQMGVAPMTLNRLINGHGIPTPKVCIEFARVTEQDVRKVWADVAEYELALALHTATAKK